MKKIFLKGLFFTLLLVAIVFPVFIASGYQIFDFETIFLTVFLIFLGFLATLVSRKFWIERLFVAILVYWFLDCFLPGARLVGEIIGIVFGSITYYLLASKHSENVLAALTTFCVVWTAGCLLEPLKKNLNEIESNSVLNTVAISDQPLRPIIHIILDEQMSTRTAPETIPSGHPASEFVAEYLKRGFQIYTRTEATSSNTEISLSQMLLYEPINNIQPSKLGNFGHQIIENRHFNALRSLGYKLSVITSNHLNVCHNQPIECSYYGPDNGHAMTQYFDRYYDRVMMAMLQLRRSYVHRKSPHTVLVFRKIDQILRRFQIGPRYSSLLSFSRPSSMIDVFDVSIKKMMSIKAGEANYFHFLLPHFPYTLQQDCSLSPYPLWSSPNRYASSPKSREQIYEAYWDQSACAHKKVFSAIDLIKKEHERLRPIIIVHGDHGSRIDSNQTSGEGPLMRETYFAIYRDEYKDKAQESQDSFDLPNLLKTTFSDTNLFFKK